VPPNQPEKSVAPLLSFDDARACVAHEAAGISVMATTSVAIVAAPGRVLAQDIRADRDFPPFARSTRDGFAVRANGERRLRILGEVRAGELWSGAAVSAQTCVAIMTGAPLPSGADAVIMLEHVEQDGDFIHLREERNLRSGENVVARGSEAAQGTVVVSAGTRLNAAAIGLAAACGQATLAVRPRPRVAVLATGDELVDVDQTPAPQQIRNSNSYALAAAVEQAGGDAVLLSPARDTRASLRQQLELAFACDLVLVAGGVSAGKYDLAENVLAEDFGAEFFFTGVRIQPGRPAVFGRAREKYFFGLPGNPVSALVTFGLLARPLLAALGGEMSWQPRFALATLEHDAPTAGELTRILPARISSTTTGATVRQVPWHGSGDMAALAASNAFLVLPEGTPARRQGESVTVWLNG
jgi:molybdopterin molybdotransferase